jgi:hypothetical protein
VDMRRGAATKDENFSTNADVAGKNARSTA